LGKLRRPKPTCTKLAAERTAPAMSLGDVSSVDALVKTIRARCYRAGLTEATDPGSRPEEDAHLLEWAADPRMLRWNLRKLRTHGGKAPGVDGIAPKQLTSADIQRANSVLLAGEYEPADLRECQIPKPDGTLRTLHIPTAFDRLVDRSLLTVLEPRLDPLFLDSVHGFRPGRSPYTALAQAIHLAESENRWTWGILDLADAFHSLPHGRLLQVLRTHFGEGPLADTLGRIITRRKSRPIGRKLNRGVAQGAPLSPLFLNVYLDHHLDKPWLQTCPGMPMIRYADDVLILCANMAELHQAAGLLRRLLKPTGLQLRESKSEQVNLKEDATTINYMSFDIKLIDHKAMITTNRTLWNSLALRLQKVVEQGEEAVLIKKIITGWTNYLGPAAHYMTRDEKADVVERIRKLVEQTVGKPVDLSRNQLLSRLHRAAQRWQKIKNQVIKR